MVPDLHETPNKTTTISKCITSCDCGLTRILSFCVPSVARGLPFGNQQPLNDGLFAAYLSRKWSHPGGPCVGSIVVVTALFD